MSVHWTLNAYGKKKGQDHLQAEWEIVAPLEAMKAIVPPRSDDPEMYASYFPLSEAQVRRLGKFALGGPVVDFDRYEYALECCRD